MIRYLDSKYLIFEDGRIQNEKTGLFLKCQSNGRGYLKVTLTIKGKQIQKSVHRLVAEAYVPMKSEQVNHKDGNKSNNHASNLEWVTNQQNRDHAVKNRLVPSGETCYNSKFTKDDLIKMVRMDKSGVKRYKIASFFGVSKSTVSDILNRKRYKFALQGEELELNS